MLQFLDETGWRWLGRVVGIRERFQEPTAGRSFFKIPLPPDFEKPRSPPREPPSPFPEP